MIGQLRRAGLIAAALSLIAASTPTVLAAEKTLVVGAATFPDSLLTGISSFASLSLISQTSEPLVERDNAGNLIPGLATKWEQVDDTTWRFHLRQGVKFHDGVEFTAEDVKFTIDRVVNPQTTYGMLARISPVTGAEIVDKYTVDIKTKIVFPTVLKGLSDIVMEPKHYYEKAGADAVRAHPMGTGPFVYQNWVAADRYELTANKQYWKGAPKVDRVVIRQIPEAATRIAALLAGEIQIVEEVSIDLVDQVNASGIAKIDEIPTTAGLVLTYDVRKPPFDNPKVRLAFDYAVDKEAIFKEMLKSHGELLQGQLLTKSTFGFNPGIQPRPFDPAKAKQLLKEAGYDFATPISIATQNGKYVSDVDICNAIAGMLHDVGVNASVNALEGGVFMKMWNAFEIGPIYMVGWYSLGDADFATVWYTKGGKRATWVNEEYEKLFLEGRSTTSQEARLKAYHRMAEILHEENPSMFLFGLPSLYGVSTKISGFGAASDKLLRLSEVDFK